MKSWKTLDSKIVFENKWYKLRQDVVELGNGVVLDDWMVAERPDYVNVFGMYEDGDVLLVRQYRHAVGKILLENVAGIIPEGMSAQECAQAELREEAGCEAAELVSLGICHENPPRSANTTHMFLAIGLVQKHGQSLDTGEQGGIEIVKMPLDEYLELIRRGEVSSEPQLATALKALMYLGRI
jgi:ADP-ribose pyrophosphatase